MITKIQTPSAINAYRQFPQAGSGIQADPFDWYTVDTVVEAVSTVTVVEGDEYDSTEKYFNVKLTASQLYTFSISGVDAMGTTVTIYYEGSQVAQSVFDDTEWTWSLSYTPSATGTYLIKVSTYSYGGGGTLSTTPVPTEITPWIEKASGVYESTGFSLSGVIEKKHSLRESYLLLPNDLYVSGDNGQGQLGNGNQTALSTFTINTECMSVKHISGRNGVTAIVDQYGRLFGWGAYSFESGSLVPVQIGTRCDWNTVFVGWNHVYALDNSGKVWSVDLWNATFTEMPFTKKIVQINDDAGGYTSQGHYYALDIDGGLWVWGYNLYGQLGLGDTTNRTNPVKLDGTWLSASTGGYGFTLAIKSDGTLWGAGYNGSGELGLIDDYTNRDIFVQIGSATNWTKVFATQTYGFASNTLGELYAWGYNYYAAMGFGIPGSDTKIPPTKVGDYGSSNLRIYGTNGTTMMLYNTDVYITGDTTNTGLSGSKLVFTATGLTGCIKADLAMDDSSSLSYFTVSRRSV